MNNIIENMIENINICNYCINIINDDERMDYNTVHRIG